MSSDELGSDPAADVRNALTTLAARLDEVVTEHEKKVGLFGMISRAMSIAPLKAQQAADAANGIINRSAKYVQYGATRYEIDELQEILRNPIPIDAAALERFRRLARQIAKSVHNL
jgi:hypothetical protein